MGPHLLFAGGAAISERCEIHFRLRSTAESTLLPAPKPKTKVFRIETNPSPSDFVGTWNGKNLRVNLTYIGLRRFSAKVSDRTQAEPLEFEAVATLDPYAVTDLLTKELASLSANADSKLARESRSSSKILTKLGRALDERSQPVRNKPDWM